MIEAIGVALAATGQVAPRLLGALCVHEVEDVLADHVLGAHAEELGEPRVDELDPTGRVVEQDAVGDRVNDRVQVLLVLSQRLIESDLAGDVEDRAEQGRAAGVVEVDGLAVEPKVLPRWVSRSWTRSPASARSSSARCSGRSSKISATRRPITSKRPAISPRST